jgi:hypothetical protein
VAKYGSRISGGGWRSGDIDNLGRRGLVVLMGWVFGNLFVGDDRLLGIISGVIFLRAQRSAFGMIFGLGIELLKRLFLRACLILKRHFQFQGGIYCG